MSFNRPSDKEDEVCINMMEYYSAIKCDEIVPFETTRMDLESIMLSEISQTGKHKNHMILLLCGT